MSQNATVEDESRLSAAQERALAALLSGQSVSAAARGSKVSRQTVHRWMREPEFRASFNGGRRRFRQEMETRLDALTDAAIANVERAVVGGDARLSFAVLKGVGLLSGRSPDIGSDDPDEIRADEDMRRMLTALSNLSGKKLG